MQDFQESFRCFCQKRFIAGFSSEKVAAKFPQSIRSVQKGSKTGEEKYTQLFPLQTFATYFEICFVQKKLPHLLKLKSICSLQEALATYIENIICSMQDMFKTGEEST